MCCINITKIIECPCDILEFYDDFIIVYFNCLFSWVVQCWWNDLLSTTRAGGIIPIYL